MVGMGTPHFTALVGAAPHGRGVAELAPPLHQAVRPWEQEELRELDFLGWNWGEARRGENEPSQWTICSSCSASRMPDVHAGLWGA